MNAFRKVFDFSSDSIARRLVVYLFLCSSVITLIGTSIQLYLEYNRDINSIKKSLGQIETSQLESIKQTLWVSNDSFLKIQLDGLLRLPDIAYLGIKSHGKTIISVGTQGQANTIERWFPLNYSYRDQEIDLGQLFVVADLRGVHQRLVDRALIIFSTLAVKTFLVSVFMLFIFYLLVGRHLNSLAEYARRYDPDKEDNPLVLKRSRRKMGSGDELDQVISAFNDMSKKLNALFQEKKQNNEKLRHEINERTTIEVALRESEQRYKKLYQEFQVILDGIPDALTLLTPDLRVIWANRGTATLLNRKMAELPGRHCYEIWQGLSSTCDDCLGRACFERGQALEGTRTTSDGRVWEKRVFPLKDKDGTVVNVIEWSSEITEKIRLAKEAELASRLASLGELSAGVAHEINNPNAMILLNAPVLKQIIDAGFPILEKYCKEHGDFELGGMTYVELLAEAPILLDSIMDGSERIRRIVEDLKDFVRNENTTEEEIFDLADAMNTAARLTEGSIKKAAADFKVCYFSTMQPIKGRRQDIEQVLVNLILNACQALCTEHQIIELAAGYDAQRKENIVTVRDEGHGIQAQDLPRIMDPFFTTKRECGGTGLGLSISARIIKKHGGTIGISSSPGSGTTVTIRLPAHGGEH
ncbi:MAG: ATP-binding protein [Pelovirga sp.]